MSGAGPDVTADRDGLAGEYVLGTLTAYDAAAVERDLPSNIELQAAVAEWERRLTPLLALAAELSPPPELWAAIERRIQPAQGLGAQTRSRPVQSFPVRSAPSRGWRGRLLGGWAVGATAIAAALGTFILTRGPEPAGMMTVLLADRTQAAWTAAFDRDGALRLAALPPPNGAAETPTPEDRVLQLWALPPGATMPTSLGLLPRGQRSVTVQAPAVRPVPGMLIEISLEPPGGSTTGRPTGPVLFIGRLSQPGPNT